MKESYNRTSTAYDFALFDTALRKPKAETESKPELEVVAVSEAKKGSPVLIIISGAFVALLLMAFIISKAMLSEAHLNVGLKTNELEKVKTENAMILAELNGSVSLEQVEKYATEELGMQKVVHAQEEYIEMDTGAMTEKTEENNDDFLFGLGGVIRGIAEYLGIK